MLFGCFTGGLITLCYVESVMYIIVCYGFKGFKIYQSVYSVESVKIYRSVYYVLNQTDVNKTKHN